MKQPSHISWLLVLVLAFVFGWACHHKPVRFAHGQHLGLACGDEGQPECLTCLNCHMDVERKPGEPAHPSSGNCVACHTKDHKKVDLSLQAPRTAAARQATAIGFSHDLHLKMEPIGGQCISCHSGLVSDEGGTAFPQMSRCFECHEHQQQWDKGQCAPCHQAADLKKLFPRTF